MYTNIGHRNHQAVQRQGHKLVELWNKEDLLHDYRDDALKALGVKYQELLAQQDDLFKAANLLVNQ